MLKVVDPNGKTLMMTNDPAEAEAFRQSYNAHPVNFGRRLAKIIRMEAGE